MSSSVSMWHRGTTSYIRCGEELDPRTCEKLHDTLNIVLAGHLEVLELDCRRINVLTASGLDALVQVAARAHVRGIEVHIELDEEARRIAEVLAPGELDLWLDAAPRRPDRPTLLDLVEAAEPAY